MVSVPVRDIANLFNSSINRRPNISLEVEARFGSFVPSRDTRRRGYDFVSGVSQQVYNRVYRTLQETSRITPVQQHLHDDYYSGERRATTNLDTREVTWIRKARVGFPPTDDLSHGVRIDVKSEETLTPPRARDFNEQPTYSRDKTRSSFPAQGTSIDLTETTDSNGNHAYEIEVELQNIRQLNNFTAVIEFVLRIVQDTVVIYTLEQKNNVLTTVNRMLGGRESDHGMVLDDGVLVQARNLALPDLVWGGILGNEKTAYTVTIKADGVRKLLYFAEDGVWLVAAPEATTWISNQPVPELIGTILDGEHIPRNPPNSEDKFRRLPGAPTSLYWYLPFDCLADKGNTYIQTAPLEERLDVARRVIPLYPAGGNNFLVLSEKPFFRLDLPANGIQSVPWSWTERVQVFFQTMNQVFSILHLIDARDGSDLPEGLRFASDGLIFTPTNASYIPHVEDPDDQESRRTDAYALRDRSLTVMPDLCKWKPVEKMTIDFTIRRTGRDGNQVALYSGQGLDNLVPFLGSRINPFNPLAVDIVGTNVANLPDGSIVEFHYDPNITLGTGANSIHGAFLPDRARPDRTYPNSLATAMSNWDWIMDPITEETLTGRSFTLVFKYHNRIKRDLFDTVLLLPGMRSSGTQVIGDVTEEITESLQSQGLNVSEGQVDLVSPSGGPFLLDIGSGRGGDTSKTRRFRKIISVEPDLETDPGEEASPEERNRAYYIPELVRRYLNIRSDNETLTYLDLIRDGKSVEIANRLRALGSHRLRILQDIREVNNSNVNNTVLILRCGGEDPRIATCREQFLGLKVDVISSMLSLSFFWSSAEMLDALVATIVNNLRPDGYFIFLTIDGESVMQIFDPQLDVVMGLSEHVQDPRSLQLGPATFNWIPRESLPESSNPYGELHVNITDTIVTNQTEWPVFLDDLRDRLPESNFFSLYRAETEKFMSRESQAYSKVYSFGMMQLSGTSRPGTVFIPTRVSSPIRLPAPAVPSAVPSVVPSVVPSALPPPPVVPANIQGPRNRSQIVLPPPPVPPSIRPKSPVVPQSPVVPEPSQPSPSETLVEAVNDALTQSAAIADGTAIIEPVGTAEDGSTQVEAFSPPGPSGPPGPPGGQRSPTGRTERRSPSDELPGLGEDQVQTLRISWYDSVVRIGDIGDGSCFIHATLKGFYAPYQENANRAYRMDTAAKFRRDIAYALQSPAIAPFLMNVQVGDVNAKIDEYNSVVTPEVMERLRENGYVNENGTTSYYIADQDTYDRRQDFGYVNGIVDPLLPVKLYFEFAVDGQYVRLIEQQELTRQTGEGQYILFDRYGDDFAQVGTPIDTSIRGLQALFNSLRYLGDETYGYVSQLIGLTIYIVRGFYDDLEPHIDTQSLDPAFYFDRSVGDYVQNPQMIPQQSIVVMGNGAHYEVIGIQTDEGIQTVFAYNDPFIVSLRARRTLTAAR